MAILTLWDDDGNEVPLPTVWVICSECRGEGRSSAYLGAFTREDIDADPDFFEAYMRGDFDRSCSECGGSGKVRVVDLDQLTDEQQASYEHARKQEAWDRQTSYMERLMERGLDY